MTAIRRTITAPNMTPQSQPLNSRQVRNNAGGFVFEITADQQLRRFLVLGTEGGTFYEKENQITAKNIKVVDSLLATNPQAVYDALIWATDNAPRNEACLYTLAVMASGTPEARKLAKQAFSKVVRTGTHLFHFLGYLKLLGNRGWGRGLRTMVGSFYQKDAGQVAYSAIKYRSRDGWSQRDALRLSHVKPLTPAHAEVFNYITDKEVNLEVAPEVLKQAIAVRDGIGEGSVVEFAADGKLPWEAFGDNQRTPEFWRALLPSMPIGALVRNLSTMSRIGVLSAADTTESKTVVAKLTNAEAIRKSRIHPVQLVDAMLVYQSGGQASTYGAAKAKPYAPNKAIVAALETAVTLAFKSLPDTGKRTLVAMDVSGSMQGGRVGGSTLLTPAMGSAIMAVQHAKDAGSQFVAFSTGLTKLDKSKFTTVNGALKHLSGRPFSGTDCAQPMLYAMEKGLDFDAFVVYTDNETWHGHVHPTEALRQYRIKSGINARLAVVGMTATSFSIADPSDIGMLDVVGLSADSPQILVQFINGNI